MANTRQVIRRVEHSSIADFDDQLWPINCVLLVLAGFVAGIVIATSQFTDVPVWQNGWFRLGILGVTLAVLFLGSWWLHRRNVRRMQLAVLLSLLVNLGVEMWLYRSFMRLSTPPVVRVSNEWLDEREEFTFPDYTLPAANEAGVQDFERPVETVTPEMVREAIQREETRQVPPIPRQPPVEEPNSTRPAVEPAPVAMDRTETPASAPRRSEQASGSQVSRQELNAPGVPTAAIPTPQVATAAPAQPALNASAAPLDRSATGEAQLARRSQSEAAQTTAKLRHRRRN